MGKRAIVHTLSPRQFHGDAQGRIGSIAAFWRCDCVLLAFAAIILGEVFCPSNSRSG